MMKPLLLMRKKGLFGPMFAKHYGISGLSKSVGNFIGHEGDGEEFMTKNNVNLITKNDNKFIVLGV